MQEQIREVESAIQDSYLALLEFKNQLWENDWSVFEKTIEYLDEITKESDFLVGLLSLNENDLFSKKSGLFTDAGQSVAGLHAVDYNVFMADAQSYADKIQEINAELANDPYNTILLDKKNEYLQLQREAIQNANDEKMAIRDLIEESYNRQLEILQELIDKRKEALQAEKDLYSFEKNVKEQTKQITDYQKQLAALSGDDSEESKSKRQQLQDQLEDAQADLEETMYDQWLTDQEKLMDDMYTDYEEVLNQRLDNIDGLLSGIIESTNANSEIINKTIADATDKVGYTITEDMSKIWNSTDSGVNKVVSEFNGSFSTTMTTTNGYISSIKDLVQKLVDKSEKEKAQNTSTATSGSSSGNGGSSGGNSGGSNSSGSNAHSTSPSTGGGSPSGGGSSYAIFPDKKFTGNKNILNKETSIVDRLKYYDKDDSWSARASSYKGLGGSGEYTGSYAQNVWLIQKMKEWGMSKGGTIGGLIRQSGEDGFVLARTGEEVLSLEKLALADSMVSQLVDFAKLQPNTHAIKGMTYTNNGDHNITFNFSLPNVSDSQSFLKAIQTDKKVQQALQSVTIGRAMGNNSLDVKRFK